MPAGEQIALEPALAEMLAQHLHHAAVLGEMNVIGLDAFHPDALGHLEHGIEPVRGGLVRSHDAEIPRLRVELDDVAQEFSELARGLADRAAGAGHVDGILAEIRQLQLALQQAAIGVRIGAHAPMS